MTASAIVLASCEQSTLPPDALADDPTGSTPGEALKLSGVAAAGLAACEIVVRDEDGRALPGGEVRSNIRGQWEATVPAGTGLRIVEATGCAYEDETTGVLMRNADMSAAIYVGPADAERTVHVTPLTTLALAEAREMHAVASGDARSAYALELTDVSIDRYEDLRMTAGLRGGPEPELVFLPSRFTPPPLAPYVARANEELSRLLTGGRVSLTTTKPVVAVDPASADAEPEEREYGLLLAAISGAGELPVVLEGLSEGLDLDASTASDEAGALIARGALAFEVSGRNRSGVVATVVDAPLRAGGRAEGTGPVAMEAPLVELRIGDVLDRALLADAFFGDDDTDATTLELSVRGLPDGLVFEDGRLRGSLASAGDFTAFVTAYDGTGNAAATRLTVRASEVGTPDPTDGATGGDEPDGGTGTTDPTGTEGDDPTGGQPGGGMPNPEPQNAAPVARVATPDGTRSQVPATFTFDASGSTDADGTIASYAWTFADGVTRTGPTISRTFGAARAGAVTLTVTDDDGASSTARVAFRATEPANMLPTATITVPSGTTLEAPATFPLDASSSSDPDGRIASYAWMFDDGTTSTGPTTTYGLAEPREGWAALTVTDDRGATATTTVTLRATERPNEVPIARIATPGGRNLQAPATFTFDAASSSDPDGTIASYRWRFADGTTADGARITRRIEEARSGTVTLTVTDDDGATATANVRFTATEAPNEAPLAVIDSPSGTALPAPATFSFDASGSSDADGTVASYVWAFSDGTTASGPSVTKEVTEQGRGSVTLTVTDDDGAEATASLDFEATRPSEEAFATYLADEKQSVRFLHRSGFGGTADEVRALVGTDAADWIADQLEMPSVSILDRLREIEAMGQRNQGDKHLGLKIEEMLSGEDHLRQRMAFALSQILVASDNQSEDIQVAYYMDVLEEGAFGNYRDLLETVTYSPHMGEWLTYVNNDRGDPETGRTPDENYAREILQLFTIGLVELNQDGTPKTGADGQPIETYDQDDVVGLARVFTGLGFENEPFGQERPKQVARSKPLVMSEANHSPLEKRFLDVVIAEGTSGTRSIETALDGIFAHPNISPFVSRQLIQRFTASDPTPAYVTRVANAFDAGRFVAPNGRAFGTGERGDLSATIAAILLDPSLYDEASPREGKIREPMLLFASWAHSFDLSEVDASNEKIIGRGNNQANLTQYPFKAPSVFNFYRPGYVAPATETGARGLTAPELQIVTGVSRQQIFNWMMTFGANKSGQTTVDPTYDTMVPNYDELFDMPYDPGAIVDHLDLYLTGSRMEEESKANVVAFLADYPVRANQREADERFAIGVAVAMVATSPAYIVVN